MVFAPASSTYPPSPLKVAVSSPSLQSCVSNCKERRILKFAYHFVIVSLLKGKDQDHGLVVDDFVAWCDATSRKGPAKIFE